MHLFDGFKIFFKGNVNFFGGEVDGRMKGSSSFANVANLNIRRCVAWASALPSFRWSEEGGDGEEEEDHDQWLDELSLLSSKETKVAIPAKIKTPHPIIETMVASRDAYPATSPLRVCVFFARVSCAGRLQVMTMARRTSPLLLI